MKKKNKTPWLLRIIRTIFPWVEKLAPWLANRIFIYLFFTPVRYRVPEKEEKAEMFSEKFSIQIPGKKIQCYRWGSSTRTIVVVHGWGGRATQFRRFVKPIINSGYQVVGFDAPGHGKSTGNKTHLYEFESALRGVVKETNACALITHSFGGVVSLYALSMGLPVKTLVNIASPTISNEIVKTFLTALNGSVKTGEAFKRHVMLKSGKPFEEFSALEFIKRVPQDLNLLLVYDEDDKEVKLDHPRELIKRFPQASFVQTKGLGHTRILKDDHVIESIVTFVSRHSSNS